jgi:hypothetical protein
VSESQLSPAAGAPQAQIHTGRITHFIIMFALVLRGIPAAGVDIERREGTLFGFAGRDCGESRKQTTCFRVRKHARIESIQKENHYSISIRRGPSHSSRSDQSGVCGGSCKFEIIRVV